MPSQQNVSFGIKFAVFLVGVFAFLQVYAIQAILPVLQRQFMATPPQMGITIAMTVLAIALVSPIMGLISDSYGRKCFIVGATLCLALPTLLLAFSTSLHEFNFWRFTQGLCVPFMTVVLLAYIGEEFPQMASRLTATYVSGTVLGGFLGRFILGHFEPIIGYQATLQAMALSMLSAAILLYIVLPNSHNFVANRDMRHSLGILRQHLGNRQLLTACTLGACVLFSLVGCFTFINLHLAAAPYHLSTAMLGNIFSVYLIGVIVTPLSGKLVARMSAKRVTGAAVVLSIIGVLLTLATPIAVIIVGLTVMSIGVFITQTATISYTNQHLTHGRSLGLGLYYMAYYTGGSIGAWVCGLGYQSAHWLGVVGLILFVQLLGLVIIRRL